MKRIINIMINDRRMKRLVFFIFSNVSDKNIPTEKRKIPVITEASGIIESLVIILQMLKIAFDK